MNEGCEQKCGICMKYFTKTAARKKSGVVVDSMLFPLRNDSVNGTKICMQCFKLIDFMKKHSKSMVYE